LGEHAHLGAVRQLGQPFAHGAEGVERDEPGVDLVERVEDPFVSPLIEVRASCSAAGEGYEE